MKRPSVRISPFSNFVLFCILIVGSILSAEAQEQKPAAQTSISTNDAGLVKMTVTVSDNQDRCLTGLSKDNFLLYVDKSPLPIVHFNARQEPASIMFLIDLSGSMQTGNAKVSRHGLAAKAIQDVLDTYDREDEFSAVSFSREPQLAIGWTRDRSQAIKALADIADAKPKGQTAFRNAVSFGLEQFNRAANLRRIVIIFSDAQDNSADSHIKSIPYNKLAQTLRTTGVMVYAINLGTLGTNGIGDIFDLTGTQTLNDLSRISGGKAFHPVEVVGLFLAVKQILMETSCQYSIGFKPHHPAAESGKLHKVKVELASQFLAESNLKGLKVYHRDGYYWSPPNSKSVR